MKKIAVFGKPGSGKSRLSQSLALATSIPLYQLDSILYQKNGDMIERGIFDKTHDEILSSETWIIDGFGPMGAFKQRLDAADTLVYIDLPYLSSYWFVTKRMLKGVVVKPEGWPEGSSVIKGSIQSYKTLRLCPKFWNNDFLNALKARSSHQTVHIIKTVSELNRFVSHYVN
ncbi:adenylate kinase [Marinomonas sp. S3726]|uniref:adenylate kinase n=1 Tax=Marinomonas sp. S3726 TaxID=579484 RepID=UPI0005FA458C|nr:adenylate kinase [Marinomonas sp. S3726]KJZ11232.1 adenylate kinase [Marinomonas sp. S3726]